MNKCLSFASNYWSLIIGPKLDDARHVALATLNYADAVVSWNFGHLVNIRRIMAINELHEHMGLRIIEIVTPEEVLG